MHLFFKKTIVGDEKKYDAQFFVKCNFGEILKSFTDICTNDLYTLVDIYEDYTYAH